MTLLGVTAAAGAGAVATVPGAPTGITVTPGNNTVQVGWTAPASDGGSVITGYRVQRATDAGFTANLTTVAAADLASPYDDATAVNGTAYYYRVAAINAIGTGADAASGSVTPSASATAPATPAAPTASVLSLTSATVNWAAPSNGGSAITGYDVQWSTDSGFGSGVTTVNLGNVVTSPITGLSTGATVYFRVRATNAIGSSAYSAASAALLVATAPAAPAAPGVTAGNAQVTVTWTAPAPNGSAITGYTIQRATDTGFTAGLVTLTTAATGTSYVNNAGNGNAPVNGTTYYYRILATNPIGSSAYSSASGAAAPSAGATVPAAPSGVSATPSDGGFTLNWTAPSDGGSALTGYVIDVSLDNVDWVAGAAFDTAGAGATSKVVGGSGVLENGVLHYVRIRATNAIGEGPNSTPITVTPRTVPSTPTAVSGTPGAGQVNLTWTVPGTDGGSIITGYRIQYSTDDFATVAGTVANTGSGTPSHLVTGLTGGTAYRFRVAAINVAGTSANSAASGAITPSGSAPNILILAQVNDGEGGLSGTVVNRTTNGTSWATSGYTSPTIGTDLGAMAMAYGAGTYVAMNGPGIATCTTDVQAWTSRGVLPSSAGVSDLGYGGGLFVASSYFGGTSYIQTSTDGVTWTPRTVPAGVTTTLRGYLYDGTRHMFVGQNATGAVIVHSTDGTTWNLTQVSSTPGENPYQVAYDGSKYVIVGASSRKWEASTVTGTWTAGTTPGTFNSIAWASGVGWVASATTPTNLRVSSDANTWTNVASGSSATTQQFRAKAGPGYVAVLYDDGVYITTNGTSFTRIEGTEYVNGGQYLALAAR
jgi:hypothetical protein